MTSLYWDWLGLSGKSYRYIVFTIDRNLHTVATTLDAVGGNYCFARENPNHSWTPIYFGETGDLSERFNNHHKASCIKRKGATHIHVRENTKKSERLVEEKDLNDKWNPKCKG